MKTIKRLSFVLLSVLAFSAHVQGDLRDDTARAKMAALTNLISQAEDMGIDTRKEQMTLRTADVFLNFANWDEANIGINQTIFAKAGAFKSDPLGAAQMLPGYERSEVILMLEKATNTLTRLKAGEISRKPIPELDWSQITHDGDQLSHDGRPVFLEYYTWKPDVPELTEFHGDNDGFFIQHAYVLNDTGSFSSSIQSQLSSKPSGNPGFIFIAHKNVPNWATTKYGADFIMDEDLFSFTTYDIDHPGAKEMNTLLLSNAVPYMAGKKYTELGYMLCNEPHFDTVEGGWSTGPVSEYTKEKFRTWLSTKHSSITDLNALWGSAFTNFNEVTITIPISKTLQGTPKWYDWLRFNQDRTTDWYAWLKDEVRTYDPQAKTHLKIMPQLWAENERGWGIDLETLTRNSEIIGNDCAAKYNNWSKTEDWEADYQWHWRELCMSHDFMKSVSPEKIIFNSESHFLSTGTSRDLYMDPAYIRSVFWLAHTHGLNASQIWYWARNADGSPRSSVYSGGVAKDTGYWGSNNQQPRLVNEVHATMMDLNSFAEEITAMQRQRKPLRIFHSETSAISKPDHMDDMFDLYEALGFEGLSMGFATKDIIMLQDNHLWDAILVHQTEYVTTNELAALQAYLDGGGTVIIDSASLQMDEYGNALGALSASSGTLQTATSLTDMKTKALAVVASEGLMPEVTVSEVNGVGHKGCMWKWIKNNEGNHVLSIVNLGRTDATLTIAIPGATKGTLCKDLIDGVPIPSTPVLKPYEVLFVEARPATAWDSYVSEFNLTGVKTNNHDFDLLNDWAEYAFGGNPTNPTDIGSLPAFNSATGEYSFQLRNDSNLIARVLATTNLVSSMWFTNDSTTIMADDGMMGTNSSFIGTSGEQLFLKLMVE